MIVSNYLMLEELIISGISIEPPIIVNNIGFRILRKPPEKKNSQALPLPSMKNLVKNEYDCKNSL